MQFLRRTVTPSNKEKPTVFENNVSLWLQWCMELGVETKNIYIYIYIYIVQSADMHVSAFYASSVQLGTRLDTWCICIYIPLTCSHQGMSYKTRPVVSKHFIVDVAMGSVGVATEGRTSQLGGSDGPVTACFQKILNF